MRTVDGDNKHVKRRKQMQRTFAIIIILVLVLFSIFLFLKRLTKATALDQQQNKETAQDLDRPFHHAHHELKDSKDVKNFVRKRTNDLMHEAHQHHLKVMYEKAKQIKKNAADERGPIKQQQQDNKAKQQQKDADGDDKLRERRDRLHHQLIKEDILLATADIKPGEDEDVSE